jgi:hypothetical protein
VGVALAAAMASALAMPTDAATIRHDRSDRQAIRLAERTPFEGVGRLTAGRSAGSAVLVAPRWVLTAAHVVDGAARARFRLGDHAFDSSHIRVHPRWTGSVGRSGGFDLALVRLTDNVRREAGVDPARLSRHDDPRGEKGWVVGHGLGGHGRRGVTPGTAAKRAGTNVIDRLSDGGRLLTTDFDDPTGRSRNRLGDAEPTRFEALVAAGDSGGGLFIRASGRHRLAGIHTFTTATDGRTDSDYGDTASHVSVAAHRRWIDRTVRRVERHAGDLDLAAPIATIATIATMSLPPGPDRRASRLALSATAAPVAVPAPSMLAMVGGVVVGWLAAGPRRHGRR